MSCPHFRTVFLSDLHLGTPDARAVAIARFLDSLSCDRLVLNGDVFDAWAMRRSCFWRPNHSACLRAVTRKMDEDGTEVFYLRGNHDDFLEHFLPLKLGPLQVVDQYQHETPQGTYLVVHGDGFDSQVTKGFAAAVAGAVCYEILLRLNRLCNAWRARRGKPYFALSRLAKAHIPWVRHHIDRFERQLADFAAARGHAGVICGHIHHAADKRVGSVHYLNSGDWVDSLTAIVENEPGRFELVRFSETEGRLEPVASRRGESAVPVASQSRGEAPAWSMATGDPEA